MNENSLKCDTAIAGGGVAGLACALELLKKGQQVTIVDRDTPERLGGLARWAFGGMALCSTAQQKRMKIPDNPTRLLEDWQSFAEFSSNDKWPELWAKEYAEKNHEQVYLWLASLGLKFLPAVNWVERGLYKPGNSLPRYHVLWGTGWELVEVIIAHLKPYIESGQLTILHQHKVIAPIYQDDKVVGLTATNELEVNSTEFAISATNVVIACGGINGSAEQVKKHCVEGETMVPEQFLNGANPISDGTLHNAVASIGADITRQDHMWNYAAGVPHPQAEFDGHGLSLIPCKSALWLNHTGTRIGPQPLITGFDTNDLCQQVTKQEKPWTWQVLNYDIAAKELAVSGSLHNPSIKNKKLFSFLKEILFGNHRLVNQMLEESEDFVCADSIEALTEKMNALTGEAYIDVAHLKQQVASYDKKLLSGEALENDDQVRRIRHARQWRPDKLRTCKPAPIAHGKTKLIAIKLQLITRKSLGGIKTNLQSQVLDEYDKPILGLYSIGEAAGFGGGGASGKRSLEGTFLSGCILTARNAANKITKIN
ncbi:FAD-dependent oxidoreductase [Thalassotalea sp. M1531]|uniref:FAD-dependent oxidoreductase n=1 Tax=Thalassotalea algicola TaxID=2716224 RepID=A0A7Y0Q722_9GAMM|nr:FAD-dependent oxidoreductase [Thalassotalea algicola]NMP32584.1 FAD-dependent oxidoreductase [Thalassotalea algicola]